MIPKDRLLSEREVFNSSPGTKSSLERFLRGLSVVLAVIALILGYMVIKL